jgi:phosphoglycerate dehydrogenase-like enzyme
LFGTVQGFGNVGFYAAKYFEQHGAKVLGVVEYNSEEAEPLLFFSIFVLNSWA